MADVKLKVHFLDGEIMEGTSRDFRLDHPSFHVQVGRESENTSSARVPFTAVKSVRFHSAETEFAFEPSEEHKVAVHFNGGEVLRGYLEDGMVDGMHALAIKLYDPDRTRFEVMAVPHSALKGIFFLRAWQGEKVRDETTKPSEIYLEGRVYAPLVDIIAEIEALSRLKDVKLISSTEFTQRRLELLSKI